MKRTLTSIMALACAGMMFTAAAAPELKVLSVSSVPTGALYADKDYNVSGLTYQVKLTNIGDEEINASTPGYSLTLFSSTNANLDLKTVPLTATIAPAEEVTVDIPWGTFNVKELFTDPSKTSLWCCLRIKENMGNTVYNNCGWRDLYSYSVSFNLVGETDGQEINKPIAYGFVKEPTTKTLRVRATGAGDVNVTNITVPEGFTVTPAAPFTIKGLATATGNEMFYPIQITLGTDRTGVLGGNITIEAEGATAKTYAISGAVLGPDDFFEGFEVPSGVDADGLVSPGWVFGDKWSLEKAPTYGSMMYKGADVDAYVITHSSAMEYDWTYAVSPLLSFKEGDMLMFNAAKKSSSSKLQVYTSPDRENWTLLKEVTFPSTTYQMDSYTVAMPAGAQYVGLRGMYCSVDNVFGGQVVPVSHDVVVEKVSAPSNVIANDEYAAAVTLRNANVKAEPLCRIELRNGDAVMATAEPADWASGRAYVANFAFTPHVAGELSLVPVVVFPDGDEVVCKPIALTVNPETASKSVMVGRGNSSTTNVPLSINYNNSKSQTLYSEEVLATYGILPGAKLTGLSLRGTASADIVINTTISAWIAHTDSLSLGSSSKQLEVAIDPASKVYESPYVLNIRNTKEVYSLVDITFNEPFVYNGGNVVLQVESVNQSGWKGFSFLTTDEIPAIYRRNDSNSTYNNMTTWNYVSAGPSVTFQVYEAPAEVVGVITNTEGEVVEGATVTLTSGNVLYTAVSDAEGRYSVPVYRPGEFDMAVEAPGHESYASKVSVAKGANAEYPVVLTKNSTGVITSVMGRVAVISSMSESMLRLSGVSDNATLSVISIDGRLCASGRGAAVDCSALTAGVYVVRVSDGMRNVAIRFVKK